MGSETKVQIEVRCVACGRTQIVVGGREAPMCDKCFSPTYVTGVREMVSDHDE